MKKLIITFFICLILLGIAFALFFNLSLQTGKKYLANSDTFSKEQNIVNLDSKKLFSLINAWRTSENRPAFIEDKRLCVISDQRANELNKIIDDDHKGFLDRYSKLGYVLSENYTGAKTEQNALNNWLQSPSHAQILRSGYIYSCVSTKNFTAVQIFSSFEK